MCALRGIPLPEQPIEEKRSEINPGLSAIAGLNAGISAVPVLPNPVALTKHLSITLFSTEPGGLSETHHHGELDTGVYVIRGTIGFKCGVGMLDYVTMRQGELGFIGPLAVHAENNPEAEGWSTGLSIRDTAGVFYFPCAAPTALPEGKTGLFVVPRPQQTQTVAPAASDRKLGALSTHHLRARRFAVDRIEIAPGATWAAPDATTGETALLALAGPVSVSDGATSLEGAKGSWWYLDDGTRWSVHNRAADRPAEVLLVRSSS
ncbi:MAG: hypothetical protein FJY55_12250 [Betaproteobacteria bacterium]|nr:hypothetical protein [Betaproteobacteria bacterium]